jgi:enamine deaminase RidA (YjgF/YER057c/UK114 family)
MNSILSAKDCAAAIWPFFRARIPSPQTARSLDGGFDTQADATFRNMQRVLGAAGSSLDKVI